MDVIEFSVCIQRISDKTFSVIHFFLNFVSCWLLYGSTDGSRFPVSGVP